MVAKRLSFPILAATLSGAVGLWVTSGALAALGSGWHGMRVGVLPSPWWLLLAVLTAMALALSARHARPVLLFSLGGLAILPWLPIAVPPAFLVWSGPLRWWLWAMIVGGILAPACRIARLAAWQRLVSDPRRAPFVAAALAACCYLVAARQVSPLVPTGDEPHYLVITQSLLADHDLKVENNYRRGDYHAYYGGDLRPDYLQRGIDGEIYSIHAPGLPIVVAPAFALFGYAGVAAFLALLSAAATGLLWTVVWQTTRDAAATWFGWSAIALSVPFFFQSFIVYPDALGAAIILLAVSTMIGTGGVSDGRLFATGAALAALPWLHTRFAVAAGALAVLILARNSRGDRVARRAAAFLAVPTVSALAWLGFFYAVYGTADPRAPYGTYTQSALSNLARGIPGLLVDQQFGLLPNAPVYVCVALGFLSLVRRMPRVAVEIAMVVVPYSIAVAAYFMWWGGFSSPARFLTPVLLPLAIPAGVWYQSAGRAGRMLGLVALFLSLAITATVAGVDRGALLYNSRDGASKLLAWLSPAIDLSRGLPSLFQTSAAQALVNAGIWTAAIVAVALCAGAVARLGASSAVMALTTGASAAVGGMAALTIVWHVNAAMPVTPGPATLALVSRYDPGARDLAVTLAPFGRFPLGDLPSHLPPVADVEPRSVPSDEPLVRLAGVPPAVYEIAATLASPTSGHLSVTIDRPFGPLWKWDLADAQGASRHRIVLPVPLREAVVDIDPQARGAVERLTISAVGGIPSPQRLATSPAVDVARYGPAIVFLIGGDAFMEGPGAWVAGGATATFAIVPEGRRRLQLFVRTPPIANRVRIDGDGWRQDLVLAPGEERLVDLPIGARLGVAVRITAAAGIRPTEFERGSTDRRFLGCWIEVR